MEGCDQRTNRGATMIDLSEVSKRFDTTEVLHQIDLTILKGECAIIYGVSGSGKSTLLSIIGTLTKASSGTVKLDSQDISELNDFRLSEFRAKTIGFVSQNFHLFELLNVEENIRLAYLAGKQNYKEYEKNLDSILETLQLKQKKNLETKKLSGGEKQRCTIARSLINNPDILLFDEPTANLDAQNTLEFMKILQSLKNESKTILVATHDPLFKEQKFVDKIIQMKDGKLE